MTGQKRVQADVATATGRSGFDDETLTLRLAATKTAQERSRLALLMTTVISVALLVATWNAYYSFYRMAAIEFADAKAPPTDASTNRALRQKVLDEWVRSRFISVPPLGVTVGIDDGPLVGGIATSIALLWFAMCVSAEKKAILSLLEDTSGDTIDRRNRVFHGIYSNSVFTILRPLPGKGRRQWLFNFSVSSAIWFLPAVAVFAMFLSDVASAFLLDSPFREPPAPPFWKWSPPQRHAEIVKWLVSLIPLTANGTLCVVTSLMDRQTEAGLEQYRSKLVAAMSGSESAE